MTRKLETQVTGQCQSRRVATIQQYIVADDSGELDALRVKVRHARELLLSPPKASSRLSIVSQASYNRAESVHNDRKPAAKTPSPTKAFFSRLSGRFRRGRSRTQKKTYSQLDETRSLISDRRGSADTVESDDTLVATEPADITSYLLEILAPLISALQPLTPKIVDQKPISKCVAESHDGLCEEVVDLVDELKATVLEDGRDRDDLDLEMARLMLDALCKKIKKEQAIVRELMEDEQSQETLVASDGDAKLSATPKCPLLPISRNPFILHSTSIPLAARRVSETNNRPIIGFAPIPAAGTYVGYVSGAQQTWARNVIRLGSYQNSMLFSPSPVAVRPLAAVSQIQ